MALADEGFVAVCERDVAQDLMVLTDLEFCAGRSLLTLNIGAVYKILVGRFAL